MAALAKAVLKRGPGLAKAAKTPKPLAFTPFDPMARPPAGSYDPAIDAEADSASRGFNYATEDFNKNTGRLNADYAVGTENLGRQYNFLKNSQTQRARSAGVDLGGWGEASKQKRDANQQREQGGLRLQWERASADAGTAHTRAGLENTAFQGAAQQSRVAQANQNTPGWANIDKVTKAGYRVDGADRNDSLGAFRFARNLKSGQVVKVRPNGTIQNR